MSVESGRQERQVPASLRGPWTAVLADPEGRQIHPDDLKRGEEYWVLVVRGAAAPRERGGNLPPVHRRRPRDPLDVLAEHVELVYGTDPVLDLFQRARTLADILNAQPGQPGRTE